MKERLNKKSVAILLPFFIFLFFGLSISRVFAELTPAQEAKLREDLKQTEAEIIANEKFLVATKNQSASLSRDIAILTAQIKEAQLKIKAKNIIIQQLGKDIDTKNKKIGYLSDRIEKGKATLADLLYRANFFQETSETEILLGEGTFSDYVSNIDQYEQLSENIKTLFEEIRSDKKDTENEKTVLDKKQNQETDARKVIEEQKRVIEVKEKEKNQLLVASKGEEKAYENILAQKRQKAVEIRAALFSLRDTNAIPFGKAYEYAVKASESTGVRPAFLLAILTQESALGKNVGSCYLTDSKTGAGISSKSGTRFPNVMSPTRDVSPFFAITKELGIDPYKTVVSCPIPSAGGWGGAMGPAQFIPSTWSLFQTRIKKALGVSIPDPWRAEDAFTASAMYLGDRGAGLRTYTAEINAACKYYTGRACSATASGYTYGGQVMVKAQNIQENMINLILGN